MNSPNEFGSQSDLIKSDNILEGYSNTIPFSFFTMIREGGRPRQIVLLWLLLCAFAVPSSLITLEYHLTGIPIFVGGVGFYFSIYLPLLFCIPIVFWFGYLWAAIPAYFATFLVGYLGGMSLEWLVVFSFSNTITLAAYTLSNRVVKLKLSYTDITSIVSFTIVSLMAALAGSVGAFIWAYDSNVGLNEAYLVWQGWWLGGWILACVFVYPILYFFTPLADRIKAPLLQQKTARRLNSYKATTITTIGFVLVLVSYVAIARYISIEQFATVQNSISERSRLLDLQNAIDGMSYPLYILLAVLIGLTYLIYRAVIFWRETLVFANKLLIEKNKELERLADTDALTSLINRRRLLEHADVEYERSKRAGPKLSILMVDIDRFKRINDELGHLIGDGVISEVAKRISDSVRPYDIPGRYGGEEFMILLPDAEINSAAIVAKRILTMINNTSIQTDKGELKVTVSIGVSTSMESDSDVFSIIERADQALLKAKNSGRDKLVISS